MTIRLNASSTRLNVSSVGADRAPLPKVLEMDCYGEREREDLRLSTAGKLEIAGGFLVVLLVLAICALGLAI